MESGSGAAGEPANTHPKRHVNKHMLGNTTVGHVTHWKMKEGLSWMKRK
jgi:hypothetical protein